MAYRVKAYTLREESTESGTSFANNGVSIEEAFKNMLLTV